MADHGSISNCRTNIFCEIQSCECDHIVYSPQPETRVKLTFHCNFTMKESILDENGVVRFSSSSDDPQVISVYLDLQHEYEIQHNEEDRIRETLLSCGILFQYLKEYELDYLAIDAKLETEKITRKYTKLGYNDFSLEFQVNIEHSHDVVGDMDRILRLSFEESVANMVPATQESVSSLKRKRKTTTVDKRRARRKIKEPSCVICLEDFSEDCEVICMPCKHEFDAGCLEEWLKVSHYCPICRYEMPTKETDSCV